MKYIITLFQVFLVFCIISVFVVSHASSDSAMVLNIENGEVLYESGHQKGMHVQILDFLSQGDRLKLKGKSKLFLNYFESGIKEEICGEGILEIGNAKSHFTDTLKVKTQKAFEMPGKAIMNIRDLQHVGTTVLRSAGFSKKKQAELIKIEPLTLIDTNVKTKHPIFSWQAVDGAELYRIKIFDFSDHLYQEVDTSNSSWVYKKNDMVNDKLYWWTILAFSNDRIIAKGEGQFSLFSKNEQNEIEEKEQAILLQCSDSKVEQKLYLAILYQQYDLIDDTVSMLKSIYAEQPENKNILRWLESLGVESKILN